VPPVGVLIWAWCLMPNHVHPVAVPETAAGLARCIGKAHRRYTRRINFREGWRGYLWHGRFASYLMDGPYALAAARYIERKPVREGLVRRAWEWPWSSAAGHVSGRGDALVKPAAVLGAEISTWRQFLTEEGQAGEVALLRRHSRTWRPLGDVPFVRRLERLPDRRLVPGKPGRPRTEGK
jgi:putative transposase